MATSRLKGARPLIRKQLYLEEQQERKLKRLARQLGITEAAVVRLAIDRLEPEDGVSAALARAGLLSSWPVSQDVPSPEEAAGLRKAVRAALQQRKQPLGLSQAILDDRR